MVTFLNEQVNQDHCKKVFSHCITVPLPCHCSGQTYMHSGQYYSLGLRTLEYIMRDDFSDDIVISVDQCLWFLHQQTLKYSFVLFLKGVCTAARLQYLSLWICGWPVQAENEITFCPDVIFHLKNNCFLVFLTFSNVRFPTLCAGVFPREVNAVSFIIHLSSETT